MRYTRPVMRIRTFVGIVFTLHLLFTNICFVGSAYAAMPNDGERTLLSREVPMSFNVVTCTWVKTDDGWKPTPDSPCASGHCLKQEHPETRCLFTMSHPEIPLQTLTFVSTIERSSDSSASLRPAAYESPPPYPGLVTTVMRL